LGWEKDGEKKNVIIFAGKEKEAKGSEAMSPKRKWVTLKVKAPGEKEQRTNAKRSQMGVYNRAH